jgi:hypothetical protein
MVKKNILLHHILYALQGWLWIESMHLLIMIIQLDDCTHVFHCSQQLHAILLLLKFKNYRCVAYYR